MTRTLLFTTALGIFLICIGISMNISASLEPTVSGYILDNCVNKTEFEPHGKCLLISNDYMLRNPEWSVMGIFIEGLPSGHAVNYRIIDDRFYVHDETWGWDYELENWQNLSVYHFTTEGLNTITALYRIP